MNESERLADQISVALNGGVEGVRDAWHGPSWKENLQGVPREAALHRPIPEAHTIGEIVMHASAWHDIVRKRLHGETPEITEAQNWPSGELKDNQAWALAVKRLFETGKSLVSTVEKFPPEKLHEKRPGVDGTWYELIIGELQHVLYHSGQVGILKKANVKVAAS